MWCDMIWYDMIWYDMRWYDIYTCIYVYIYRCIHVRTHIYIYIYVPALSSHGPPPPQPMVSPPTGVLLIVEPVWDTEVQGAAAATYMEIAPEHNYMTKFSWRESIITTHQPHHTATHPIPQGWGRASTPLPWCVPLTILFYHGISLCPNWINKKITMSPMHQPTHTHRGGAGAPSPWPGGASQGWYIYIYIYIYV